MLTWALQWPSGLRCGPCSCSISCLDLAEGIFLVVFLLSLSLALYISCHHLKYLINDKHDFIVFGRAKGFISMATITVCFLVSSQVSGIRICRFVHVNTPHQLAQSVQVLTQLGTVFDPDNVSCAHLSVSPPPPWMWSDLGMVGCWVSPARSSILGSAAPLSLPLNPPPLSTEPGMSPLSAA